MSWTTFLTILSVIDFILVAGAIVVVLQRQREPRSMLVWILTLLLLPVLGLIFFLMAGELRIERKRRKLRRHRKRLQPSLSRSIENLESVHGQKGTKHSAESLIRIATRLSGHLPTSGNDVAIYHEDEENFLAIMEAIEQAKHHVHLEYYIFQPDETGQSLRDLLVRKVKEGVTVRLLVDYIGCWNWPRAFRRSFIEGGVKLSLFDPVVPWRGRWRVNLRNHRKIVVVDGVVGFTGSQNIGDEYRGRLAKFGPWRDTHMRITGPAVHHLQEIFVEDWHYATKEKLVSSECFPRVEAKGDQIVQVIASGPDSNARTMHHLLLSSVTGAQDSVAIITPYFAPDTTMIVALQSAAYRGLRVQLLIPSFSNHWLTLWAGRSFYEELIEAGVEIYEYHKALLHSKVVIIDDSWGMVGSANMDQRSFRINLEVTSVLYDDKLATNLRGDFDRLITKAERIQSRAINKWSFRETIVLGLARLVSPLL
ncbi:MAG TPA: cardiolipin synthase [Phycisphaerae bacterium]|nr:cardiolipin synthase [Phycisphaerales bacterium]HNO80252.1 cardiolipin synthase [Phycisphaerae bacterium]